MRTIRNTIEQVVFEEEDFKELGLKVGTQMGQFEVLEMGSQRYVCDLVIVNNKREYHVRCSYQLKVTGTTYLGRDVERMIMDMEVWGDDDVQPVGLG